MALRLVTPAPSHPVTLAEAKTHLRVDISDDDAYISALIVAACDQLEHILSRALLPQTWEMTSTEFPAVIELTRAPVTGVTSIKYIDEAGTLQTLSSAAYLLSPSDDFGVAYIEPEYGYEWPLVREQSNAVQVRYVAGYADAAAVPEPLKQWIKLAVGTMYENREMTAERPQVAHDFCAGLIDRYRIYAV